MSKTVRLTNSSTGGPVFVDVKDDKIVRIIPMNLTDDDADSWQIEARGQTFKPPRKATITAYTAGFKSTVYSDKRLLYPMKRVDFDPNGERNEEKRGESGYERISWDEALDIVSKEMIRIRREYGSTAIMLTSGSHHLWGNLGYRFSAEFRFMNLMGLTYADHNPDSWEGWHWGGVHTWGNAHRLGNPEQYDLLEDTLQNAEMIVFWSSDPEVNNGIYSAYESTVRRQWMKKLGIKMVFIDPFYNHSAGLYADKWFSPRVGTDAALAAAIAYVWITEGTYDKEYVADKVEGFEEWKAYILGESDAQPKTPEWAAEETLLPAHDIVALAREWAKRKTMLAAGGLGGWGGACRSPIGMDWSRMMIALAALQGMGKPGSNIYSTTQGAPVDCNFMFPGYAEGGISGDCINTAAGARWYNRMFGGKNAPKAPPVLTNTATAQHIPRLRIPECLIDGKFGPWRGKGFCGVLEDQFKEYKYPGDGFPQIQMYYKYGGSHISTMCETNRYVRQYRNKKLPFVVNQSIWFEGEAKFADIILPACTNFERWDISEFANCAGYIPDSFTQCNHRIISLQKQCIKPLGKSKSDYQIFADLSKRLGLYDAYTDGGKTELDWIKLMFEATDLPDYITWDEFFDKGYFVVPVYNKHSSTPAYRWFAEGRERDTPDPFGPRPSEQLAFKGLSTTSGKIELVSSSLKKFDPNDPGRPLMPMYQHSWEGHHTTRINQYPLAVVSPHPRFSFHTMGDGKDSFMNDIKDHRVLANGHYYWILRINEKDAKQRGIENEDLIKAFNDRGQVIFSAQVTQRVPPGTCHCYESAAEYKPLGEPGNSPDIGGIINILTSKKYMSENGCGMAPEHALIEIEKWDGQYQGKEA